jgi:peptidoglycan L-alanyl-D-glutamate endopeptidase CwlK
VNRPSDVLHYQRLLACAGFSPGPLDGIWGSRSEDAAAAFAERYRAICIAEGGVDKRSEGEIKNLLPAAQIAARRFLHACAARGFDIRITSGLRTYAEQTKLYAQGRTAPGDVVTHARAGQSNHHWGIAWDVSVFHDGKYMAESPDYDAISFLRPDGVEWGGNWPEDRKDRPHYQLATGLSLAEVRRRFEAGLKLRVT